jgi:hypothetical protein
VSEIVAFIMGTLFGAGIGAIGAIAAIEWFTWRDR